MEDTKIIKNEKIRIFGEIDKVINETKSKIPIPISESKFIKRYNKLKEQELGG